MADSEPRPAKEGKEGEKEAEGKAQAKPARKIPLLAIFGALVVLQAGLSFLILSQKVKPHIEAVSAAAVGSDGEAAAGEGGHGEDGSSADAEEAIHHPGPLLSMEPLVLNLMGGETERQSFVKMGMALEVADEKQVEHIRAMVPVVTDTVIRVLGARTVGEVLDPEGKETLRADILASLGIAIGPGIVKNVYFTSFVVQ